MENQNRPTIRKSFIASLLSVVIIGSFLGYWVLSFANTTKDYFNPFETTRTYLSLYPIFAILGIIIGAYLKSNTEDKKPGSMLIKISVGVLICTVLIYLGLFFFPSEYNSW